MVVEFTFLAIEFLRSVNMSAHLKLLLYVDECMQKCDSKPERIGNG